MRGLIFAGALLMPLAALSASVQQSWRDGGLGERTFIVRLSDPPLATFRGFPAAVDAKRATLAPTSPAMTGARQLDVHTPGSRAYRQFLAQARNAVLAEGAKRLSRELRPLFIYDVVLNAVALELNANEAATIAKLAGVEAIEPEWVDHPLTDAGPRWIGAESVWNGTAGTLPTRSEGVVVGVIDTGVNASHPSFAAVGPNDRFAHSNPRGEFLGLCQGATTACNAKLIGIYDFTLCTGIHAGSGCDNREVDDGSDVDGHGSHVASTAAGNYFSVSVALPTGAVDRVLSGVAPHANVISYKACEQEEDCRGTWTLAALQQAAVDRVDVVNYSIGGGARSPWSSSDAIAMLNAREAGTVVVVAAGNDGPLPGTVSTPANAPWVIAVANSTHDRVIANRLLDLSGGATPPPSGGMLLGSGQTAGYGPAALTVPTDFPACSTGAASDFPPSGISNPWQPRRFNGEIVVCQRGVQARVAKSNNVRLAGGGGMVLLNTVTDGETTVSDAHSIPATHLGFSTARSLSTWLASGSGHRGRIEGANLIMDPGSADLLASSSSRGPVADGAFLKPDLAAPGTSIFAAAPTGTGMAALTGTSMASPHVAGAAALLRAARREWTVSDIESALTSTALPVIRGSDGRSLATALDQGNGRANLFDAMKAGLSLRVTPAEFRAANPALGGDPMSMNRASLLSNRCFEACRFSRSVTDLVGGGTWRAEFTGEAGMAVTVVPAEFTLTAGASRNLDILTEIRDAKLAGRYVDGKIRLRRTDSGNTAADTVLTVSVFADPGELPSKADVIATSERGFFDLPISGLIALSDLTLAATELVAPLVTEAAMPVDPTRNDRFDNIGIGSFFTLLDVPPNAGTPRRFRLRAETSSPTAVDVDLFVGADFNTDGLPQANEEICDSAGPTDLEQCLFDVSGAVGAQQYWVLAQNWAAGTTGNDVVRLETSLVDLRAENAGGVVLTGPGKTSRLAAFSTRISYNDPTLLTGESRIAYLQMQIAHSPRPLALIPLTLRRGAGNSAAQALLPGQRLHLRLAPGTRRDRLFIDLPPNASSLTFSTSGNGQVDLFAANVGDGGSPLPLPAPANDQAGFRSVTSSANEAIEIGPAGLGSGRWYVMPTNVGALTTEFDLNVEVSYGAPRAEPRRGPYFNPSRPGAGVFLFDAGANWGLAWYTYLQDSTPTWYLAVAPRPGAQQGVWVADLLRYRWNGNAAFGTKVGEAVLSLESSTELTFSWNVDGESGSERYVYLDGGACPQRDGANFDVSGLWAAPTKPGFGYSVLAFSGVETNGAYFYDDLGQPRWAFGSIAPFTNTAIGLDLRQGACALCAYREPAVSRIGQLTRSYDNSGAGRMAVDVTLPSPMSGRWLEDLPVVKLSDPVGCR